MERVVELLERILHELQEMNDRYRKIEQMQADASVVADKRLEKLADTLPPQMRTVFKSFMEDSHI